MKEPQDIDDVIEMLKDEKYKNFVEDFAKNIRKKADPKLIKKIEETHDSFIFQRIFEIESVKWLFYGIIIGLLTNIIVAYAIPISTGGIRSLTFTAFLIFEISLIVLGITLKKLFRKYKTIKDVLKILTHPQYRKFIEASYLLVEDKNKKNYKNNQKTSL